MNLKLTARIRKEAQYRDIKEYNLHAEKKIIEGNGSVQHPYLVEIKLTNHGTNDFRGVIHLALGFKKENPRFFLPAFMYGDNRGEAPKNVPNEFPRIREKMDRPASPWWMIRSDRLSHPVAMVFDSNKLYGLSGSPYFIEKDGKKKQWTKQDNGKFYQYTGYTCSTQDPSIGYTLGYENAPWLFVQTHTVLERAPLDENCFVINKDETITFKVAIYEIETEKVTDVNEIIKEVYYQYHQSPRKASSKQTAVRDLALAIANDAWLNDEKCYSGFVYETDNENVYRYNKLGSLAWTNGIAVAVPQLLAGLRLEDEKVREQAIEAIESTLSNCMNQRSGLPYDAYNEGTWSIKGWWFDGMRTPGHSAYLTGQAIFYVLKAYYYEKKIKQIEHKNWLEFAVPILEHIEKTKNTDHEYPFIFSEKTGAGIEYDALGSSWCLVAKAYYSWLTGDLTGIEEMKLSEKHYYETYVSQMECYGAPLDTDKAIDSEGILAYIRAVHYLHAITGEMQYLEHMKVALDFEFTFKFCYNSPIKVPPLSKVGWSSCGGSVTSVANPHIHPMSSSIVDELLYYYEQTGDEYVKRRMDDVVGWGCQTYNTYDKEYDYGKKGWMSERFCHSEGLLVEKYSDGSIASTWMCLMPWASACIIDGLVGDYWKIDEI